MLLEVELEIGGAVLLLNQTIPPPIAPKATRPSNPDTTTRREIP